MNKFFNRKINRVTGHRMAMVLVIILFAISIYFNLQNRTLTQTINNSYERAFYELVEYADNVETLLAKAQISSSPEYSAKTLTDIWRTADLAQACLSQIPLKHTTIENAEKYFNQLSDYSYSLSKKTIENKELAQSDLDNLENMYVKCKTLNQTLSELMQDMSSDSLSWGELTRKDDETIFAQEVSNISKDSFGKIEEDMQDYEGLIYDGPFSEHMTSPEVLGLGNTIYSEKMAQEVIYQYVPKDKIKNIKYNGIVDGNIRSHSFDVTLNNDEMYYINITERDGRVYWINYPKAIGEEKINKEEANKIALKFLEEHGFDNMKESYFTNENGMLTINYAYVQDGVICYTDLVKVKVALDDGSVIGIETKSYLNSHRERKIAEPKITMEEAKAKLNPKLEILSEGKAIIPTDFQTELTTYEFKGKIGENNFIVYVNVENGKEEKIFMILDTPGGTLAI